MLASGLVEEYQDEGADSIIAKEVPKDLVKYFSYSRTFYISQSEFNS